MPFAKPENPKAQLSTTSGTIAHAADLVETTTARQKPISVFASVNGYAQAEIIVDTPRAQPSRC
jgi:hypothetical protein